MLRLDAKESYWQSFWKWRTIRKPKLNEMPKMLSECFKKGRFKNYYITLFEDHMKRYWRIIPKGSKCNCEVELPDLKIKAKHRQTSKIFYVSLNRLNGHFNQW